LVYKLTVCLIYYQQNLGTKQNNFWVSREVKAYLKNLHIFRQFAVEQLKQGRKLILSGEEFETSDSTQSQIQGRSKD
jgi:hypothetical protein